MNTGLLHNWKSKSVSDHQMMWFSNGIRKPAQVTFLTGFHVQLENWNSLHLYLNTGLFKV